MKVFKAVPSPHERPVSVSFCPPLAAPKLQGAIEFSRVKQALASFRARTVAFDSKCDHPGFCRQPSCSGRPTA